MDISDRNFKPCVCGYQVGVLFTSHARIQLTLNKICRFCWHHIKENLNKRCPACRRVYTEEGVEFKPINPEECVILVSCHRSLSSDGWP
jgi:CCR4-NOT transcription complex subunit 4